MEKGNMNHIVARASTAFKANQVALEHPDETDVLHEEELAHAAAPAQQPGVPQNQKQMKHGLPSSKSLKNLRTAAAHTVNLRDCGSISSILRQGRMFRSSQVMSATEISKLGIKSVLDLRIMRKDCKKEAKDFNNSIEEIAYTVGQPVKKVAQALSDLGTSPPVACHICSDEFEEAYTHESRVFHADLVPAKVKMYIFYGMPKKTKLKTICAPCFGKSPEAVMAPAVADAHKLGYGKLYKLLLDHFINAHKLGYGKLHRLLLDPAKKEIAKALRVFVDSHNYPVLVHCIHGKDRTGLIVMIIMLLCSVEPETVVLDYIQSEIQLKSSRDKSQLELASYLTSDEVMASKADVMQGTIEYMNTKYGSAAGYVKSIGVTPSEVSQIRLNMLLRAAPRDLLERLSLSGNFGRSSNSPMGGYFGRRSLGSPSQSMHPPKTTNELGRESSDDLATPLPGMKKRKEITRRSTTGNLSTLSRRSKDQPGFERASKQPQDLLINKM